MFLLFLKSRKGIKKEDRGKNKRIECSGLKEKRVR